MSESLVIARVIITHIRMRERGLLLRYTNYLIGGKNSNKSKPLIIRRDENN